MSGGVAGGRVAYAGCLWGQVVLLLYPARCCVNMFYWGGAGAGVCGYVGEGRPVAALKYGMKHWTHGVLRGLLVRACVPWGIFLMGLTMRMSGS